MKLNAECEEVLLESLGFNTQKEIIKEYWLTVQRNSSKFETILKRSIS
jgi:hypothetical protein